MANNPAAGLRTGRANVPLLKAVLMNLWVYPAIAALTFIMSMASPLLILTWKIATRWPIRKCTRHLIWIYGKIWLAIISPFVKTIPQQMQNVPTDQPCIMVINHYSFFDTFFMGALPIYDVNLTLRSWPFKMLWYTLFMRIAGYLDLESSQWDEVLTTCNREFSGNASLLFFPEGHRSRDGRMQRFHSGAFKVAVDTDTPIVPLCIIGTDVLLPPRHKALMPATVKLRALPPVFPKDFAHHERPHAAMRKAIKADMETAVQAMRDEP